MTQLKDQIAIVMGGGRGLGRVIALALAREGADVVLAARAHEPLERTAAEVRALGRRALPISTDVASEREVTAMVERTARELGRIDVLVNNAAVTTEWKPIVETSLASWDRAIGVNLTGAMLCARECLRHMLPRRRGAIVNILGTGARNGVANMGPHSASKFGLLGLTQALALETAAHGIRVNAIAPWAIEGEHLEKLNAIRRERGEPADGPRDRLGAASPMKRIVKPEEVADLVVFLASSRASAITGQTIDVTTGVTMH